MPDEFQSYAMGFSLPAHYLEDRPVIGFPVRLGIGFGYTIANAFKIRSINL